MFDMTRYSCSFKDGRNRLQEGSIRRSGQKSYPYNRL